MPYDINRKDFDVLEQYEMVRLTLPVVSGTCTLGDGEGWYTPKTCQESQTGYVSFGFATPDYNPTATMAGVDTIYPQIVKIAETPPKLKPNKGLGSRGTLKITLADFPGDPGPTRTSPEGKFLEKMKARWVMEGHDIVLYLAHGNVNYPTEADYQRRTYRTDSLTYNNDGTWTLECTDNLYFLDKEETVWPLQTNSQLRQSITEDTITIPVDADTDYTGVEVIRIGSELMSVVSVQDNQTGSATLTVGTRGTAIMIGSTRISVTEREEHDAGDEIFICRVIEDLDLADLLSLILTDSGLSSGSIPLAEWKDELAVWHPTTKVNTIFTTPDPTEEVVSRILQDYLMDMWMDVTTNSVRLSAISVWRQSDTVVEEGKGIQYGTFQYSELPDERYSRASVMYDKKNLTESDDIENYRKLSLNVDARAEQVYGVPRLAQLENSFLLDKPAADLLVQRYVARYKNTPQEYTWSCPERFLDFSVGDVVDLETESLVGFDGLPANQRGQITSIQPKYTKNGRSYSVKAFTYEQPYSTGGGNEFTLSGRLLNINLFTAAGAPPEPVDVTFILNNVTVGSTSNTVAAIRAGGFPEGSTIKIIVRGLMSSRGGNGGLGGHFEEEGGIDYFCTPPTGGQNGGIIYDAEGTDTEIYLAGTVDGIQADGYMKAPGGGARGGVANCHTTGRHPPNFGGGGGGGAGIEGGKGGGTRFGSGNPPDTVKGEDGQEDGTAGAGGKPWPDNSGANDGYAGGSWGEDGVGPDAGSAGKGLVKNGAVVNIYTGGQQAARFINGNGETPDAIT